VTAVQTLRDPQHLTTPRDPTACYGDSFTSYIYLMLQHVPSMGNYTKRVPTNRLVGRERGPLNLMTINEELFERKVAAPV
jgi:hypothetical protein